jgi:hypothetical protein
VKNDLGYVCKTCGKYIKLFLGKRNTDNECICCKICKSSQNPAV